MFFHAWRSPYDKMNPYDGSPYDKIEPYDEGVSIRELKGWIFNADENYRH